MITGILMLNLGGPDSLDAVRPFLFNLFSDREIIRLGPAFLQKPIAWLISVLRAGKTKRMYELIGGKSPILDITRSQAEKLEQELNMPQHLPTQSRMQAPARRYMVYTAMRYWHPFINEALQKMKEDGIDNIIVLSMYPHYSKATTGSSLSDFRQALDNFKAINTDFRPQITYIKQWYDFPPYIEALASSIAKGLTDSGLTDFDMIYSAHSLPESFILEGDPYLEHIKRTISLTNEKLAMPPYNVKNLRWHLSFQSKTGPVTWLKPSTDETIARLSGKGCRNIVVVPISFVSDHIETLYEIDIMYGEIAREHGINLYRCPSLNVSPEFIGALKRLVIEKSKLPLKT